MGRPKGPPKIEKYCPMCETTKLITEFYSDKSRHDELSARCIPCTRSYQSKLYWKHKNGSDPPG